MPKIRQGGAHTPPGSTPAAELGCLLTGELRLADGRPFEGQIVLSPAQAGMYRGRMVGAGPVEVGVSGGGFEVVLPPSLNGEGRIVMGRYRWWTRPSGLSGWLDVPDRAQATLSELWAAGMFSMSA